MILSPSPGLIPHKWTNVSKSAEEDFLIFLKEPFMKHYAGTIFCLGKANGVSDWEEDERLREKLSFSDKYTYDLPDSGKGSPISLPKSMTSPLPLACWQNMSIQNGSWRITGLKQILKDKITTFDAVPDGLPPFQLAHHTDLHHKDFVISLPGKMTTAFLSVFENTDQITFEKRMLMVESIMLKPEDWPAGFYTLILENEAGEKWECTAIKLFPFYVDVSQKNKYLLLQTLW